ncbi:Transglutaminase-like superfamily protein [Solibacillus isronensis B3W22]|uniref:Transglutaminase-like superfamily protein n=1 Tax=Solibacillus isronensis B3W22 TaxID=1224748 RepID=K1KHS3_9BACL|nr:transglutaminaseTgpA domain-containing protein [Solibacillus isronensis]AMO87089.1 transglutaminase [Solibacillus silvestris]EKB43645.1 Transglutaminase-like superfamily protein [Solibacillus isronensis B3W22]
MRRSTAEKIELAFFYFIVFLILREWLIPVMELTNTGYFTQFVLFIGICLVLGIFSLPFIVNWFIKLAYITWFVVSVYKDEALTTTQFLSEELKYNLDILLAGEWIYVSDPFRTSLFFILIWMLIYLIQHWVSVRYSIYYFLLLTVFFIGTLDTFTEYDGTAAIVKVMLLGLVLTSLLFIKRLMQAAEMQKDWMNYLKYATPIIIFVMIAGIVATVMPKAEPQWSDPVPYVKNIAGIGGNASQSVATVGYGENDERLGGPFAGDNTIVYEIKTPIRQYWRVETKDFYTSKGWEQSDDESLQQTLQFADPLPLSIKPGSEEPQSVEVQAINEEYLFLLQAYGITSYNLDGTQTGLRFNTGNEKILPLINSDVVAPASYEMTFQQPEYSYVALKESLSSTENDSRYLQLPDNLPQRVTDLALEITDMYDSVYDKARAIEGYFARSGFQYETTNVQVPSADQDYVDQFLFETRLGYCDNFSTSMVVMLRSIGIQARWVKGFSSGERIGAQDGTFTYQVTNNDAHSWVEAYIDGIGWMPFEPTIGFSNPMNINYDVDFEAPEEEQLPDMEEPEAPKPELEEQDTTKQSTNGTSRMDWSIFKWVLYGLLALVVIGLIVAWKKRGKWQPKLAVQMNKSKLDKAATFEEAYFVLLKQLERVHLKRGQDETLQQFAMRVDRQLDTTKMSELTAFYERLIYAKQTDQMNTTEMKEIWEYLINRTSG